jgi:hypothetical protein
MAYRLVFTLFVLLLSFSNAAVADDLILTGRRVLDKDTVLSATTITFKADAQIVTNGYKLTVLASKMIAIEGTPTIISFEQRNNRPAGDPGRSAGPVGLVSQFAAEVFFHHSQREIEPRAQASR